MEDQLPKKSSGLSQEVDTDTRYRIYLELRREFPTSKKTYALQACELNPTCLKFYEQKSIRPDKYAEVKKSMLKIYEQRNGRVGRIVMAQELRKEGIYICDQTARKLMAELGLKYRKREQPAVPVS